MRKIIIGLLVLFLLSASVACAKETGPTPTPTPSPTPAPGPSPAPAQRAGPDAFTSILELYAQKTTLEEAAKIMGITVPMPDYLPEGFEIQEVYVQNRSARLLISDGPIEKNLVTHTDAAGTRQRYEVQSKIEMSVSWSPEFMIPVRLPEEKVDIKGSPGYLLEVENHKRLVWNWFPDPDSLGVFELGIEVGKGISKEELVKIAESVEFNVAPELYTPQSDQVISERLYDIRKGEFRYLCIYEDGSLTRIEMEGLREPVSQHVRIRKTGKLDEEELSNLVEFFEVSGFKDMDKNNEFSGSPEKGGGVTASDVHYSVSARLGSSYRSIKASNYISPDGGKTYPDMPYPLNEIYKRLKDIADNRTEEIVPETPISGTDETHTPIPAREMQGSSVDPAAPDALMPAPGLGPKYRANIITPENPWPPIEISEAHLGSGSDNVSILFREYIKTAAGESRNNIIRATTSGKDINSLSLYADDVPAGIKLTVGSEWSGPLSTNRSLLLVIEISPNVAPGQYPLEIGLEIDGKDYGTLPCTVEVTPETTSSPPPQPIPQQPTEFPLRIISVISPVRPLANAILVAQTEPEAECSIIIDYGPSGVQCLRPIADGSGRASWTWTVGNFRGIWEIVVKASYGGETASQYTLFTVQ